MARSRGSGTSAGYSCGTTRRPMNRRFVRSVRRATPGQARRAPGEPLGHRRVQHDLRHQVQAQRRPRSRRASRPPTAGSSPAPARPAPPPAPPAGRTPPPAATPTTAATARYRRQHQRSRHSCIQHLYLMQCAGMRDIGCDNENVSPTPAQQARAAGHRRRDHRPPRRHALRPARHRRRPDDPLRPPRLPLPRRPAPAARPLPPVDPQERRQDRHPHPDRRPARRLRAPGSTTTAGSANWSPSSRHSASTSPRPTPAGTASQPRQRGQAPA